MLQVFRTIIIVTCWLYVIYQQFYKTELVSELSPISKASAYASFANSHF